MQQQNGVYITNQPTESDVSQHKTASITKNNLIVMAIYLAVRQCIPSDWKNNKDQFLSPNNSWLIDDSFQNDCLTFSLFHGQNKITSDGLINEWIPFTEQDVNAKEKFESNFMSKFISGKLKPETNGNLFEVKTERIISLVFSMEAQNVFNAGRELWRYYHAQTNSNVNASFYDIREYFQGRNTAGKMNNKSDDTIYNHLISNLRSQLKELAKKIEPKIYDYGFLKR
jgi:hypothetical protein